MNLKIKYSGKKFDLKCNSDETFGSIYRTNSSLFKNEIYLCKVNNKYMSLHEKIGDNQEVEFLDIKSPSVDLVYQATFTFIYLKAIHMISSNIKVNIHNSINYGIYTELENINIDKALMARIRRNIKVIISKDLPIKRIVRDRINEYSIGEFSKCFYQDILPSTGYIKYFGIKKYKKGIVLRMPTNHTVSKLPTYIREDSRFKIFDEEKKWQNRLGVENLEALSDTIKNGKLKEIINMSEELHSEKIHDIANMIKESKKRIVLISGPSSSGKTTFSKRLCLSLKVNGLKPLYIGMDDYFLDRKDTPKDKDGTPNYEGIEALDLKLFNSNVRDLLNEKTVNIPTFDFIEGKKIFNENFKTLDSHGIIVIEGIHALNKIVTSGIRNAKFKIYISPIGQLNIDNINRIPTTDVRLIRRISRDIKRRGNSPESTIISWEKVRDGEDKNIFPYSPLADVFFNSFHIYELAILKSLVYPLLKNISKKSQAYPEALRLIELFEHIASSNEYTSIPKNSILQEFI